VTITILGRCPECEQERPVKVEAYPQVSGATDKIIVYVRAVCEECDTEVDFTWAGLHDLRPDWTEYEKAKEALGL
jgi:hypothetical protein